MKFLFFAGGATVTGMEVALLSLMARLNAIGHRAVAIVSGWNDGAYLPMLDAAGIEHHEVFLGRIYRNNPDWTRGTLYALREAARDIRAITASLRPDWVMFGEVAVAAVLLVGPADGAGGRFICTASPSGSCAIRSADHLVGWPVRRVDLRVGFPGGRSPPHAVASPAAVRRAQRHDVAGAGTGVALRARCAWASSDESARRSVTRVLLDALTRLPPELLPGWTSSAAPTPDPRGAGRGAAASRAHVTWPGFISDTAAIYAGLDIVVAPAVDEGFGMTVVEAGAFGLPVVAARSGAFPEVVRHGETGLLVEPDDADTLAQALQRLIADAACATAWATPRAAHVAANFTVEKMADRFVAAVV